MHTIESSKSKVALDYWMALFYNDKAGLDNIFSIKSTYGMSNAKLNEISGFKEMLELIYKDINFDVYVKVNLNGDDVYGVLLNGKLLYEERFTVDGDLKIIHTGNAIYADVVDKYSYINGSKVASFAIKSRGKEIKGIYVNGYFTKMEDILKGETFLDDDFLNLKLSEKETSASGRYSMKIIYSDFIEKSIIFINNEDHKYFLKPTVTINKNKVLIGEDIFKKQVPWFMNVFFKDGSSSSVLFPINFYEFEKDIEFVILTDALDNDWHIKNT